MGGSIYSAIAAGAAWGATAGGAATIAVRINMLAELMNCSHNPTAENQSKLESTWEVSKKYLGKTLDFIFASIMPQTAEAAPPAAALVIPPALIYLARNLQMLNRIMNTVKSLPRLWVEIRELKKNLEIRAQNIEDLFVHEKNDSKVESFDEYDGVFAGIFERSSKKPSTSASSRSNMNFGGGSAMPPDPEKEPKKERKGTDGYKSGNYWEDRLYSFGSKIPGKSAKTRDKFFGNLKEAKRKFGGEIKMDENGTLYKFDTGHKNGKIHLERIEKRSNGFYGTGEVDPETGRVLRTFERNLGK